MDFYGFLIKERRTKDERRTINEKHRIDDNKTKISKPNLQNCALISNDALTQPDILRGVGTGATSEDRNGSRDD